MKDTTDTPPAGRAKRTLLATIGWVCAIIGPIIGLVTPIIPIGFIIFGVGVGLIIKNSPRGKALINHSSRWAEGKFPKIYGRMPRALRDTLRGEEEA